MRSRQVSVQVNLDRVRQSAEDIRRTTGVRLIAVIKADSYGLGASRVSETIADLADDFAYFTLHEGARIGRPGIVMGPPDPAADAETYRSLRLRPAISNRLDAQRLHGASPVVQVDSGMQRFGCDPEEAVELARLCDSREMMTHACNLDSVETLREIHAPFVERRHAAASALLTQPTAWFDAVRPGIRLYRGALTVTTPLAEVRATRGPVGYTRFETPHVGVMLAGYSHGVAPGPVRVNGREQRILEVGMNTTFVSLDPADRVGDPVTLLGEGLDEARLAAHFGVREHEILCRYSSMGMRRWIGEASGKKSRIVRVTTSSISRGAAS